MKKIIFATGNQNKMKEIRQIMEGTEVEVCSMKEAGIVCDVEEDGTTFLENACIKAKAIADLAKKMGEEPGVYSARYMGEDTSYRVKNANLISRLEGVPIEKRTARFVCAIAAVLPTGEVMQVQETIEGYIGYEEKGENGFGYDPIFMVPEFGCTTAELSMEQKNKISHRGKALAAMKNELLKKELI